jgi:ATP synthase F1 delta subunit
MRHNTYIKALYQLSASQLDKVLDVLHTLDQSLTEDVVMYLDSPMIAYQDKKKVMESFQAPKDIEAFLLLWVKERRMHHFHTFYLQFTKFIQELNKEVVVDVFVAKPINPTQQDTLKNELKAFLQAKRVLLNIHLNETIIGGMKLQYEGKALDYSVVQTLDHMKNTL